MTRGQSEKLQRIGKLRNTRLCSFFLAGKCKYNDQCAFAHDTDDLLEKPNLAKTKICYKWQRGRCGRSAAECRFAHGDLDKHGLALVKSELPCFGKVTSLSSTTTASTSAGEADLDQGLDHTMSTFAIKIGHQAQSPKGANAETLGIDTAHAVSPLAHEVPKFKKQAMLETCLTIFFTLTASMTPDLVTRLAAYLVQTPPCPILTAKLEQLLQEAMPEKYED
eukprot:TRINITY_DN14355_c0_g2_i1.p1 TRINITY_DN14355_c0_g2~~TRINITY_DN14355_c0_g2_i1.p1  ORF type:complete len:222 (-),score=38.24 TRINITY_DN14355_c0_g2_i1:8-673(-)